MQTRSLFLFLCLYVWVSLSVSLCRSLSFSVSFSLFVSVCLSRSLSLFRCLSLSLCLGLRFRVCVGAMFKMCAFWKDVRHPFAALLWRGRCPLLGGEPATTLGYLCVQFRGMYETCGNGRSRWWQGLRPGCPLKCRKAHNAQGRTYRISGKMRLRGGFLMQLAISTQPACSAMTRSDQSLQRLGRSWPITCDFCLFLRFLAAGLADPVWRGARNDDARSSLATSLGRTWPSNRNIIWVGLGVPVGDGRRESKMPRPPGLESS